MKQMKKNKKNKKIRRWVFSFSFHAICNTIEIYINSLSTTTQIFTEIYLNKSIAWYRCQKSTFILEKNKSVWKGISFPSCRSNWIHVPRKYFPNYSNVHNILSFLMFYQIFFSPKMKKQYLKKILRPIPLPPLSMLFASIWDSFLTHTSILLLG